MKLGKFLKSEFGRCSSKKQNLETIMKITDRYDDIIFLFTSLTKIFQEFPQTAQTAQLGGVCGHCYQAVEALTWTALSFTPSWPSALAPNWALPVENGVPPAATPA